VSVADVLFVPLGLVAFAAGWHAAEFVPVDRGGLAAACFLVATGGLSLVAAGAVGWADELLWLGSGGHLGELP
jgi:hypothetical protein